VGFNNAAALQRGPPDGVEGVEVLTRGPVHEAFAETVAFDPEPGVVVASEPPEAIEELPPEQKPEGANVDWIPGYWAWDDERNDFLWVSGIWRALPPGHQWVPGYWAKSGQGAQWTSGYWADAKASEIDYLPQPPQTVEAGPNIAAPSADHTWLPGCWVWQQNRYAWRPGYWATAQPNWVWIPSHYVWSPRGYVFIDGYYDYSVARRGVLFAPVYFPSTVYSQRGFSYSPVTAINPAVFTSHLFLRPSYGHYYFGDYYASNYTAAGFSPWFSFASSRYGYDPFYAQQRWHHRNDGQWHRRVEADFTHRRDHEEARPPRTWTAQRDLSTRGATAGDQSFVVAASLDDLAKSKDTPIRLAPVAQQERQQIRQRGQEVLTARQERQKLEVEAASPPAGTPDRTAQPVKVKLPRTPIAAQPVERLGRDHAPPQAIEAPQPDATIEPKPRTARNPSAPPTEPQTPKREPRPQPAADTQPKRPGVQPTAPRVEPRPQRPDVEPKANVEPKSNVQPKARAKAESNSPAPDRSNRAPQPTPQGQAKGESKGSPPGGARENPQAAPQGKPKGESKNKSK
jgi:hypothetical protein